RADRRRRVRGSRASRAQAAGPRGPPLSSRPCPGKPDHEDDGPQADDGRDEALGDRPEAAEAESPPIRVPLEIADVSNDRVDLLLGDLARVEPRHLPRTQADRLGDLGRIRLVEGGGALSASDGIAPGAGTVTSRAVPREHPEPLPEVAGFRIDGRDAGPSRRDEPDVGLDRGDVTGWERGGLA